MDKLLLLRGGCGEAVAVLSKKIAPDGPTQLRNGKRGGWQRRGRLINHGAQLPDLLQAAAKLIGKGMLLLQKLIFFGGMLAPQILV